MKLATAVSFFLLPLVTAAPDYKLVVDESYIGRATVTLSTNVNWNSGPNGEDAMVDGKFGLRDEPVGYTSHTCNVATDNLGSALIDLGEPMQLDAVRIVLKNDGKPRKYCNLFVNAWETGPEPMEPLENALTTAPTEVPTKAPVTPGPTKAPTEVPTKAPVTPGPTKAPIAPTKPPGGGAGSQGNANALDDIFAAHGGGLNCNVCAGPAFVCESLFKPTACPREKPLCGTHLINHHTGKREVTRYCIDVPTCYREYYMGTSDMDRCTEFDPRYVQTLDFECTWCCADDLCNTVVNPQPALFEDYDIMVPKLRAKFGNGRLLSESQVSNIYASPTDHAFGPTINATGLVIPLSPEDPIRYVKIWVGKNSLDDSASIVEVQPMIRPHTDQTADLIDWGTMDEEQGVVDISGWDVADDTTFNVVLFGSSSGDPHFTTWSNHKFDFHGGCDLVLLKNEWFQDGLGLFVHIRTKISTWWSSIETAVVKVGMESLEVTGGEEGGSYWLNHEEGKPLKDGEDFLLSGFSVHFHQVSPKQKRYRIDFGHGDAMSIETYKDFVRVHTLAKNPDNFKNALGMMGSYPSGAMVARDGITVLSDPNQFGQEWQVLSSEPMLFHTMGDGVHHPSLCAMPDVTTKKRGRRLGESLITEEDAAVACNHVHEEERDACIFDVMATNDKDMAGAY